jgi:DNA mismatch repair protein MutS
MAIARAVVEYCVEKKRLGCKTLFATHYHELTVSEGEIAGVKNYNIAAKKKKDEVIFLRKIVRGGADQSYGIEVAQLAGVPDRVIKRAREILEDLEKGQPAPVAQSVCPDEQISLMDLGSQTVLRKLRMTDVNILSPIEALNLLAELKQDLNEASEEGFLYHETRYNLYSGSKTGVLGKGRCSHISSCGALGVYPSARI